MSRTRRTTPTHQSRGFSLIEFLIAITISATLLAATMSALDISYKSYKSTTESASINMATRLAMHRLTTLIRNGAQFGPFPTNPIAQPRIETNSIEFISTRNADIGSYEIWSIQRVPVSADEAAKGLGPFKLDAEITSFDGIDPAGIIFNQTLMYRVTDARFLLEYDVGPRLKRATIDLTVGARQDQVDTLTTGMASSQIRMVSSVRPRRINPI